MGHGDGYSSYITPSGFGKSGRIEVNDRSTVMVNAAFGLCRFREAALYFFESDGFLDFEAQAQEWAEVEAEAQPFTLEAFDEDLGQFSTVCSG